MLALAEAMEKLKKSSECAGQGDSGGEGAVPGVGFEHPHQRRARLRRWMREEQVIDDTTVCVIYLNDYKAKA